MLVDNALEEKTTVAQGWHTARFRPTREVGVEGDWQIVYVDEDQQVHQFLLETSQSTDSWEFWHATRPIQINSEFWKDAVPDRTGVYEVEVRFLDERGIDTVFLTLFYFKDKEAYHWGSEMPVDPRTFIIRWGNRLELNESGKPIKIEPIKKGFITVMKRFSF